MHALYALCRTADDVVDRPDVAATERAHELDRFVVEFDEALRQGSTDPVLHAVARTVHDCGLDRELFDRFFAAMRADLSTTSYETWDDLCCYMDGSAAVIGEMLLPILDPYDASAALEPARALGLAFQLTNFLRDVDEDLDLGRQYLPQDDVRGAGVDLTERRTSPEFADLMRFEIDRCRGLYRRADEGIALLPPRSARCVRTARRLYSSILDRIEEAGYDVFAGRVSVPTTTKLRLVAASWSR